MDKLFKIDIIKAEVALYPNFLNPKEAHLLFGVLQKTIAWEKERFTMFGKTVVMKREVAWYGDSNASYTYSNTKKIPLPWIPALLKLKFDIEQLTQKTYNSCLLNRYFSGQDGMGWHSDNEPQLGKNPSIASLSLGADRKFAFKHSATSLKKELLLNNGSLLHMFGTCQQNWQHALPKTTKIKTERINLTFRNIITIG
jgi:alkylated DNA repair dioxygenase AlkB